MLFKEMEDLDNIVPYEIAMNAKFEAFFCVDTMQDLVNEIWTTNIRNHNKHNYLPVSSRSMLLKCIPIVQHIRDEQ